MNVLRAAVREQVPIPRSRPSSAAQEVPDVKADFNRNQLRPSSAPPSGPANGGTLNMPPRPATAISGSFRPGTASSKGRPGTAQSRLSRGIPEDGIPDDISEISGEDDVASLRMARMEKLRIEQGKNLYHIVREEQELEKERLRMLSAVQPKKVAHLNRSVTGVLSASCCCVSSSHISHPIRPGLLKSHSPRFTFAPVGTG